MVVAVGFFLCVAFFFGGAFCLCVVVAGVFAAVFFCLAVCVLPELPQAARAIAATIDVTTVRFISGCAS